MENLKTLQNIQINNDELIIVYNIKDIPEFFIITKTFDELPALKKEGAVRNFLELFNSRISKNENFSNCICQITPTQHYSEERILWYKINDATLNIITISSMTLNEKVSYLNLIDSCKNLIE